MNTAVRSDADLTLPMIESYEAPRGPLETTIANVWRDVIKVPRVGRNDNFFQLGGHSLQTLHIVFLLKAAGTQIELAELFDHQTIASLARYIETRETATPRSDIVALRPGGSQNPLFLVHELTGSLVYAHMLAPHIDADVPLYGLPPANSGVIPPTVAGMAAAMVPAILELGGGRPVRLAGWSFGGLVAYEIARQLHGVGKPVDFLGLIDTHYKSDEDDALAGRSFDDRTFLLHMLRMASGGNEDQLAQIRELEEAQPPPEFGVLVEDCRAKSLLPYRVAELPPTQIMRVLNMIRGVIAAEEAYVAEAIPGPVSLFTPDRSAAVDPYRGWTAILPRGSIEIVPVAGNHLSLMDPAIIGSLGRAITAALRRTARD